jgi:hypothetical protein
LEKVVAFWGYEFFPGEHRYPLSSGGWFSPSTMGVRTDLLYIPEEFNQARSAAAEASKDTRVPCQYIDVPASPYSYLYSLKEEIPGV